MMSTSKPAAPTFRSGSSAEGLLTFLHEEDPQLRFRILQKLDAVVDIYWHEICDAKYITLIESFGEDETFIGHHLASSLASKCFYHLRQYDQALNLALNSGDYFNVAEKSEYVETILATCIDIYKSMKLKQEAESHTPEGIVTEIDPKMEAIIDQMFERCYKDECFEQAIGIAIDTRRIDYVERTCECAIKKGKELMISYTFKLCIEARNIPSRDFRRQVMEVLVRLYRTLAEPDYPNVCFSLQFLDRAPDVAEVLYSLLRGTDNNALMAYQIAFDLVETENQGFIIQIMAKFNEMVAASTATPSEDVPSAAGGGSGNGSTSPAPHPLDPDRLKKIKKILTEGYETDLTLHFCFKNCNTDPSIIKAIKKATETKPSILHNATIISHAFSNAGTTKDLFLRENQEWMLKSKNWARFTTTAAMGVIHKGHVHESRNLFQTYLPSDTVASIVDRPQNYSEGGAMFGLGLIHAAKCSQTPSTPEADIVRLLLNYLQINPNNPQIQHGASLGVGLAAMGTGNAELMETLMNTIRSDNAIAGEGAALGLGLVYAGKLHDELVKTYIPTFLEEMQKSKHEKIVRGLALMFAMMSYGMEEQADVLIEQLITDRDPCVRYGGAYAMACAYCGTGDNKSVKKLLHLAVSDVNDDVRRASVISLGFLNFRNPETVPKLVELLAESFNFHVRYASCIAIGVACAGTGLKDAIDMLNPLLEDPSDIVRQGAFIAMAMVMQQVSEIRSPTVKKFYELIQTVIAATPQQQTVMTKMGAILAAGILDAGGRNVAISMLSRAGFVKMGSVLGMAMFCQYWYWYPLTLFLSLTYKPTVLIGLNKNFDVPNQFDVMCNAPTSLFAYPKQEEKKGEEKKAVATAVLSTTVRAKAREAKKEAKRRDPSSPGKMTSFASTSNMDVATTPGGSSMAATPSGVAKAPDGIERTNSLLLAKSQSYLSFDESNSALKDYEASKGKTKEPSCHTISNPSRLIPVAQKFLTLIPGQRYKPVVSTLASYSSKMSMSKVPTGIVMLIDTAPDEQEDVTRVELVALETDEAPAPDAFDWSPDNAFE